MARKARGKKAVRKARKKKAVRKAREKKAAAKARGRKTDSPRKGLSADALFALVRKGFGRIPDHRPPDADVSLADALMSAFAMFSLKDPSLLAFDERRNDKNLKSVYRIENIPCDTYLRTTVDPVDPELLRPLFKDVPAPTATRQGAGALRILPGVLSTLARWHRIFLIPQDPLSVLHGKSEQERRNHL